MESRTIWQVSGNKIWKIVVNGYEDIYDELVWGVNSYNFSIFSDLFASVYETHLFIPSILPPPYGPILNNINLYYFQNYNIYIGNLHALFLKPIYDALDNIVAH